MDKATDELKWIKVREIKIYTEDHPDYAIYRFIKDAMKDVRVTIKGKR